MKSAKVVIGANFGDEGKGLVTDYFSAQENSIVVRFNGGAQAGHTVVRPDGVSHVHGHFGSGTLNGSPTYLSRHFVSHPHWFYEELELLKKIGIEPKVYADGR